MIQPRLLTRGDRVAIVAPAGSISKTAIDRALAILSSWGLDVVLGRYVFGKHGYFSGTDEERLADFQNALDDPTIAAILFARGGYGTTRILPDLQFGILRKNPKWIIGFSDITALHLQLIKLGMVSIHGDVGTTLGRDEQGTEALYHVLFQGVSAIEVGEPWRQGVASGVLTGGNLALIADSLGTPSEIDTDNRILFLEEIGEQTYRVDRMLQQLLRAGKLTNLAGLVVGQFSDITKADEFGATWKDCLEHVGREFNYPVAFGLPIGHERQNFPLIHGAKYALDVSTDKVSLIYQAD